MAEEDSGTDGAERAGEQEAEDPSTEDLIEGDPTADVLSAKDARVIIARGEAFVLDVRNDDLWADARIPGATHAADADQDSLPEGVPDEGRMIVVCEDGRRSAELAAKLREDGREAASIEGGMEAWRSNRLPTEPSVDPFKEETEAPKLPGAGT